MPTLRQRLKRPETYLIAYAGLLLLATADSFRPPEQQLTARGYIAAVRGYQMWARPTVSRYIRCRYRPTCSEYSIQSVARYGIRAGLVHTLRRLRSCTTAVPPGTYDPP